MGLVMGHMGCVETGWGLEKEARERRQYPEGQSPVATTSPHCKEGEDGSWIRVTPGEVKAASPVPNDLRPAAFAWVFTRPTKKKKWK